MPKWRGHLYNWYDTRTLRPLERGTSPPWTAAIWPPAWARPGAGSRTTGARTSPPGPRRYQAMDFRPLYDPGRRLFRIGWDESAGKLSEGLYDLLSSEARLTGYLCVARGEVPRRHWRRLSAPWSPRTATGAWPAGRGRCSIPHAGALSPAVPGEPALGERALCLYVQRHDMPDGQPWGQSEAPSTRWTRLSATATRPTAAPPGAPARHGRGEGGLALFELSGAGGGAARGRAEPEKALRPRLHGPLRALGGRGLHSLAQLGPRRQACAASWRTTWA